MDILECDVPELEGDISSRYTHSIVSMSSRMLKTSRIRGRVVELIQMIDDHRWDVKTPQIEALSEVDELHECDPYSLASVDTQRSAGSPEQPVPGTIPRADVLRREKRLASST